MVKEIPLSKDKFALVDDEDYERLAKFSWHCGKSGGGNLYARRMENKKTVRMHREIMKPPEGMLVDHINGDGLDNRKENLRVCTFHQNCMNVVNVKKNRDSKYRGIYIDGRNDQKNWIAAIIHKRRRYHIGMYKTEIEAALAWNKKALELRGEFAVLNVIEEGQNYRSLSEGEK